LLAHETVRRELAKTSSVTAPQRCEGTGGDRGLGRERKELALEEDQLDLSGFRAGLCAGP
jgi:hypothetical protein